MELQILFLTDYADPISFCTKDLPIKEHVDQAITSNGGEVTDTPGHHTVCLVSKPKLGGITVGIDPPYNTFSADYIRDCVWEKKLQPLKDYWVHKVMDFDDERFNPLSVMLGNLTWEDCKKKVPTTPTRGASAVNPDDELFYNDDLLTGHPQRIHPKARQSYTHKERIQILQYIKRTNGYSRVNGNAFWKELEEKEVCPRRTWQSMREHFRRYIILHLYQFPSTLTNGFRHDPQLYGLSGRQAPLLPSMRKDTDRELDEEENHGQDVRKRNENVNPLTHVQVREEVEEERERKDSGQRSSKPMQAASDTENRQTDKRVNSKQFFEHPARLDKRDEKVNQDSQESILVIPQLRSQEGRIEKSQDTSEDGSCSQHQNETEEKKEKNDDKRNAQKPKSQTNIHTDKEKEEQEDNEFEISEGEWGLGSPSLPPAPSNFQRPHVCQESQGFAVTDLHALGLEAEENVNNSTRNSKVLQQHEEQQEPDSSIELGGYEEKMGGENGSEIKLHTHTSTSNNPEAPLPSLSCQMEQEAPPTVPSVIHLSDAIDEMESRCFTPDSDRTLSPEIALCDNNIHLHHVRKILSPQESVNREEGKNNEGDVSSGKEEKTVKERLLGKEIPVSSQQIETNLIRTHARRTKSDGLSREKSSSRVAGSIASPRRRKMEVQNEEKEEKDEEEKEEEEKNDEVEMEEENDGKIEEVNEEEKRNEKSEEDLEEEEPRKRRGRQLPPHPKVRQTRSTTTKRFSSITSSCSSSLSIEEDEEEEEEDPDPVPRQQTFIKTKKKIHTVSKGVRVSGAYSVEEDLAILQYIEEEDAYGRVGGRAFWEEMANIFDSGRTWQSLKERFRKRIMTSLQSYVAHGLSERSIMKLERSITMKTGSGKDDKQQIPQKKRQQRQLELETRSKWGQGRRAKTDGSQKKQDKSSHSWQHRKNSIKTESKPYRGKLTGKRSSNMKLRRHRSSSRESEESEDEQTLQMRRNIPRSAHQPHHSKKEKKKQQQDSCSEESEDEEGLQMERNVSRSVHQLHHSKKEKKRQQQDSCSEESDEHLLQMGRNVLGSAHQPHHCKKEKRKQQQDSCSEESDEEVLQMGRNVSHSAQQPHRSKKEKKKQQEDPHSGIIECGAMTGKTIEKVTTSTATHTQLKRKTSLSRSISEGFKVWKQKVLRNALESDNISDRRCSKVSPTNFPQPSTSRAEPAVMHSSSKVPWKKPRLAGVREDTIPVSKRASSNTSMDSRSTKTQKQARLIGEDVQCNTGSKKQSKRRGVTQRGDSDNSDDGRYSRMGKCDTSEAMDTRFRTIPRCENNTDDSDGSLPDLSNKSSANQWTETHIEEEEDDDDDDDDKDEVASGLSSCLFEIDIE